MTFEDGTSPLPGGVPSGQCRCVSVSIGNRAHHRPSVAVTQPTHLYQLADNLKITWYHPLMPSSLDKLISRLVEDGRAIVDAPRCRHKFAYEEKADDILNDIERYPEAFVLGSLCNRRGSAIAAWKIPYKIYSRHHTLEISELVRLSPDQWLEITSGLRMPTEMAEVLRRGVLRIADVYHGNAAEIWVSSPSSATVVRRFLEFYGVGPKIATMAANILVRTFKVPFSDYHYVDISADSHILRVMARLGFVDLGTKNSALFIYSAREANPEFPGVFDKVLWDIGKEVCGLTDPSCGKCRLADLCRYANTSKDLAGETPYG